MNSFPVFLLLASLLPAAQAQNLARLVPQIEQRATYNGGWALGLPGTDCPADAPVACGTSYELHALNPTCCPSGQTCFGGATPYCCPTNSDCVNVVSNLPVCANLTWNMFELNLLERFFFCCEPGQIGVLPISGFAGLCEPVDQQVASSLIATPATQVGGAAVTTVVGGGATGGTGPMSTVTISSTLKNGGVTTITTAVAGAATPTSTGAGPASTGTGSSGSGSTSSGNHLSIGAIVGIAIGGLALIAAAFMLLRRYCAGRNKQDMSQETYAGGYEGGQSGASIYSAMPAVQEYKSRAVGVQGSQGYGYGGTPPPQQGGYGPPVEAPQRWDGRVEMGTGR